MTNFCLTTTPYTDFIFQAKLHNSVEYKINICCARTLSLVLIERHGLSHIKVDNLLFKNEFIFSLYKLEFC